MQQAANALSTWNPGSLAHRDAVPETWVEAIFTRLSAQLGAKVADLFAGVPPATVKAEWAEALAGFDPSEISRGLKSCQTRAFAPTLGEFLRLCRPALDPEIAWTEAAEGMRFRESGSGDGEWSHPAVYRAAQSMAYELRCSSFRECRKRWEWQLGREFAKGWGEAVPPSRLRLENEARTRPPNEQERQLLANLKQTVAPPLRKDGAA